MLYGAVLTRERSRDAILEFPNRAAVLRVREREVLISVALNQAITLYCAQHRKVVVLYQAHPCLCFPAPHRHSHCGS